jgi:hypothetical protein
MGPSNDFEIWDGEKTVELPGEPDATLYFVGRIHTPWKERKDCPKNARESEAVCIVDVDARWRDGLKDVETLCCSTGWTNRHGRSCYKCRATTVSSAGHSPCDPPRGPIRLP